MSTQYIGVWIPVWIIGAPLVLAVIEKFRN